MSWSRDFASSLDGPFGASCSTSLEDGSDFSVNLTIRDPSDPFQAFFYDLKTPRGWLCGPSKLAYPGTPRKDDDDGDLDGRPLTAQVFESLQGSAP